MAVSVKDAIFAGVLAAAIAMPAGAAAQGAKASTIRSAAALAAPGAADKWTCVSRAVVEIAPVSYDTAGQPSAWVKVQRVQGEVVAAERVSELELDQLRRLPCGEPDSDLGGVARVG